MSCPSAPPETTELLANFATSLRYEDLPAAVVDLAKATLLDSIGLGLLGHASRPCEDLTRYFMDFRGAPNARIWRTGTRLPSTHAAWVLSSRICAFALDAVQSRLHVPAVVIGAAIATADRTHPAGDRFIAGVVAGMEGLVRIGLGVDTTKHYLQGWRPTTTCGPFGAALAAGSIIGLDTVRMVGALGIAGDQAAGLFTELSEGSASLVLGPGRAAFSGVLAAEMAACGIYGSARILESDFGGFFGTISTDPDLELVAEGLGREYRILGLQTKMFPIPASLTTAVECAIDLRGTHELNTASISDVTLFTNRAVASQCGRQLTLSDDLYVTGQRAQLSAPYIVASALTDGRFDVSHLTDSSILLRDEVIALSRRISVVVDETLDEHYPRVAAHRIEVRLKNGDQLSRTVDWPYGSEKRPASALFMTQRFESYASLSGLDAVVARQIIDAVDHLEDFADVTELFDMIS